MAVTRIDEFYAEHWRKPQYLVMSHPMAIRLNAELQITVLEGTEVSFYGVQVMVIADFGDEIICADKDYTHV